jgi:hypothetical protein
MNTIITYEYNPMNTIITYEYNPMNTIIQSLPIKGIYAYVLS